MWKACRFVILLLLLLLLLCANRRSKRQINEYARSWRSSSQNVVSLSRMVSVFANEYVICSLWELWEGCGPHWQAVLLLFTSCTVFFHCQNFSSWNIHCRFTPVVSMRLCLDNDDFRFRRMRHAVWFETQLLTQHSRFHACYVLHINTSTRSFLKLRCRYWLAVTANMFVVPGYSTGTVTAIISF
jgi:hypothetical protein